MKNKKLTIFDAGVAFILAFVISQVSAVVGTLGIKLVMSMLGKTPAQFEAFCDTAWGYLIQAIFLDLGFVIVFLIYRNRLKKDVILNKHDKQNSTFIWLSIALGVATLFLLSGTINHFQWLIEKMGVEAGTLNYEINSFPKYLISLISLAVVPAICEELLFRGVIINVLRERGTAFAIIMSSVMFSLFHFSLSQLIYPVCFGIILAIVYLRTNNIFFPMLLHFANNALSLTIQFVNHSETTGFEPSVFTAIYAIFTLAVWVLLMCYYIKAYAKITQPVEEDKSEEQNQLKRDDRVWFWSIFAIIVVIYICLVFV